MRKGFWKRLSYEDKFDRKYACWACNHKGWRKYKRNNRRTARRKLKRMDMYLIVQKAICKTSSPNV